mmetsp:Transcript_12427/g.14001  ORF Transcript_12427/g.14001 Transcript_12427/m.14001 type:complete len:907 (+) Transcript_12427:172-2892(+)
MDDPKKEQSEWKDVHLPYHLDTVGIGEVFVSPPPCETLYKTGFLLSNESTSSRSKNNILTWEIIGSIKSCPEDFIVREIGGVSLPKENISGVKVAHLTDTSTLPPPIVSLYDLDNTPAQKDVKKQKLECIQGIINNDKEPFANNNQDGSIISEQNDSNDKDINPKQKHVKFETSRRDVIKGILNLCCMSNNFSSRNLGDEVNSCDDAINTETIDPSKSSKTLFANIEQLYEEAKESISNSKNVLKEHDDRCIIIPPFNDDLLILQEDTNTHPDQYVNATSQYRNKFNRGTFHRTLKNVFPLLSSSVLNDKNGVTEKIDQVNINNSDRGPCVKVVKDKSFFNLVPFLMYPQKDLMLLYEFRNDGCVVSNDNFSSSRNRRKKSYNNNKYDESNIIKTDVCSDRKDKDTQVKTEVILTLKPDCSKDQRRDIHQLITKAFRDFSTSTLNNLSYHEDDNSKTTSAIVVQWSQKAQRNAKYRDKNKIGGKRERSTDQSSTSETANSNTLCVLKKRRQEHLSAVNHLVSSLKCRQSDIGLAGMKDMYAVTYQWCTLRNIAPLRARKANDYLIDKGIEIGNFERVNWYLQQGMLKGNHFEIILRDLKRVEIRRSNDSIEERCLVCDSSHFDAMIKRVQKSGFVNFYGEQRVGNAGPANEVGVRGSDIGRAMLQENFSKAIDLLITGRNKLKGEYIEGSDLRTVRKVWKDTGGDPSATLAVFPKGNVMCRERTVLKGLKRYGKHNPIDALKCLGYNVRMFWINAYQSYVWNQMASERLGYGIKPLVGDLYIDSYQSDDVKIVTDISVVNITQIVLPLPGHSVQYPKNFMGQRYNEFLQCKEGIEFKRTSTKEATAKGGYRHLIVLPEFIEWQPHQENSAIDNLTPISAAKVEFSLPSGSFATMLLRELMVSSIVR